MAKPNDPAKNAGEPGACAANESTSAADLSRRHFIENSGLAMGAAALGFLAGDSELLAKETGTTPLPPASSDEDLGPIPRATLGRTGEKVSILGLGTSGIGRTRGVTVEECASLFSEAIDRGINYVDTARRYGVSETALGNVLKTRRDKVFLVTKCLVDTKEDAQESFETSLRELKVDHVDLLHLHSTGNRDLDAVLKPGGVWDYFLKLKEQGKTRFLGITGHSRPAQFLRMLDTKQVDVMMVAMNFVDRFIYGFEDKVLPTAREQNVGVMAMKVFGGPRGGMGLNKPRPSAQMDPIYLQIATRYARSLEGITGMVIGLQAQEELHSTIRYVLNAPPLSKKEKEALEKHGERLANEWGPRFGPIA